jgi:hypothetical protein
MSIEVTILDLYIPLIVGAREFGLGRRSIDPRWTKRATPVSKP